MARILVTGTSNGLGKAIAEALHADEHTVAEFDASMGWDVRKVTQFDITSIAEGQLGGIDILVNCAGVNGIDFLEDMTEEKWDRIMDTNAKGIFKMSQACLPYLIESKGTIVNIVSNAAHMPMTSSLAYNASKGAALIMTKQLARELTRRHGITVFSISPNKLSGTEMSRQIDEEVVRTRGWTMEEAQKYQLAGLLAGEETPPEAVAGFLAYLLKSKENHKYLTGCDLQYGL